MLIPLRGGALKMRDMKMPDMKNATQKCSGGKRGKKFVGLWKAITT